MAVSFSQTCDELRTFMISSAGQSLLREVLECLEDVQRMAGNCRVRSRVSSGVRAAAGATIATASVGLLFAGSVAATGGAALPGTVALAMGAGGAVAVGLGTQVANVLVKMGWERADAAKAEHRLERLKKTWSEWDFYFEQVLAAAIQDNVDIDAVFDVEVIAAMGMQVGFYVPARTAAYAAFAVGGRAASKVIYAVSGVGLILGLVDFISGISSSMRGASDCADQLDTYADQICAVLHLMLAQSAGSDAYSDVATRIPSLALLEVGRYQFPCPNYRPGDLTKKLAYGRKQDHRTYMEFTVGDRQRRVELPQRLAPAVQYDEPVRLLTRIFGTDASLKIAAFEGRSVVMRHTLGNPQMGPAHTIDLRRDSPPFVDKICNGPDSIIFVSCKKPSLRHMSPS